MRVGNWSSHRWSGDFKAKQMLFRKYSETPASNHERTPETQTERFSKPRRPWSCTRSLQVRLWMASLAGSRMPPLPVCCDFTYAPPHLAYIVLGVEPRTSRTLGKHQLSYIPSSHLFPFVIEGSIMTPNSSNWIEQDWQVFRITRPWALPTTQHSVSQRDTQFAQWFPGSRMSYLWNSGTQNAKRMIQLSTL